MTNNAEMKLSLTELLLMIRHRIKLVLIIGILCAVAGAGYGVFAAKTASPDLPVDDNQNAQYQADVEAYDNYRDAEKDATISLKKEWADLYQDHKNNPLYQVDPFDCEYEQIVVRFSGNQGNHDGTVSNWIARADDHQLFGEQAEQLSKYKNSLILFNSKQEAYSDSNETVVQVVAVDGFDTDTAKKYLVKLFKQQAADEQIELDGISSAHIQGRNENVALYKKFNRDSITSAYNALDKMKNAGNIIQAPVQQGGQQGTSGTKTIIKYLLAGLILGLGIGAVLAVFLNIRKGCVISQRQMRDSFDMEMISDCSEEKSVSINIMNANLDLMTKEGSEITVLNLTKEDMHDRVSRWNQESDRVFHAANDIFSDADTIEILQKAEGIVVSVRMGESKLDDLMSVMLRCRKLNRPVLGYVLV